MSRSPLLLRSRGVDLLLEVPDTGLPRVRHWGRPLGEVDKEDLNALLHALEPATGDSPFDVPERQGVLPEHGRGWFGRPGVQGSRGGRDWSPVWEVAGTAVELGEDGGGCLSVRAEDASARLGLTLDVELTAQGLVRLGAGLRNGGDTPYTVGAVRLTLPVPARADEVFDLTGRHAKERVPQRRAFTAGLHAREVRGGRPGLDAPLLLAAGEAGFGHRSGEVWGVHVAWSGNQELYAERAAQGDRLLGAGELLEHGEVVLGPGEEYSAPDVYGSYGVGLDGVAGRFHAHLRARDRHPRRPRPVICNTWEAVYFDHGLDRLTALADRAAQVGVERFVLDDGWFAGRRDDTTSLGDWTVSDAVWPDGLGALVEHVRGLGMEFGLWVEPEMVNLDSDLARAHPEWLFCAGGRVGLPSRHQHVLDLAHPGAFAHVRGALVALLDTYDIAYLKWDHNRALNDAGHAPEGTPGVHAHTRAVYRLLAELAAHQPGLEIESCAGGGGRVDLGILDLTDRVWASDCIDPLERQQIQRYTQLVVPPELIGTHLGAPRAHTTGRTHDLAFRAEAAVWGHLGIEWDLTTCTEDELSAVADWVALHRRHRRLLHSGTVVVADHPDPAVEVHGVVGADGSEGLYAVVSVARPEVWPIGRVRLPGLDRGRRYRVCRIGPGQDGDRGHEPPWTRDGVVLTGGLLEDIGLQAPGLLPEHSVLLHVLALDRAADPRARP